MALRGARRRARSSRPSRDLTKQQLILGPVSVLVRWRAHSYVVRQSLGFFQNDFAGRIATRVMQVGPAVRDVAANSCDVIVWVAVHWIGAFLLFFEADWRLVLPLADLARRLCGDAQLLHAQDREAVRRHVGGALDADAGASSTSTPTS